MARLFVAVWPSREAREQLTQLPRPALDGVRWTSPDQWHVTLRFLGEVDAATATAAFMAISAPRTVATMGPSTRLLGRVWIVPVAGLDVVASAANDALAGIGRPPDRRPFHGHITVARLKDRFDPPSRERINAVWDVTDITLVESRLDAAGARYTTIATVGLT